MLPIFNAIQDRGGVALDEMYRVFNMGIGMILIVAPEYADAAISKTKALGDKAYPLGEVVAQASDQGVVEYVG